jgi:hypothetical protein
MKKLNLLLFCSLATLASYAQLRMSYGATATIGLSKTFTGRVGTSSTTSGVEYTASSGSFGALIFPKYHIKNNLSIGAPIILGASFSSNSQSGTSSSSFGYHLPICVTYHGGSSVYENEDAEGLALGYYGGVGLGLANASQDGGDYKTTVDSKSKVYSNLSAFYDAIKFKSFGPFVHAGAQFKNPLSKNEKAKGKIGVRVAYQIPLNKSLNYVFASITYGN